MKWFKIKIRVLSLFLLITIVACQTSPLITVDSEKEPIETPILRQSALDPHPYIENVDPLPNATISVNQVFEIVFNQPMDQASVEAAIEFTPRVAGSFEWPEENIMRFIPDQQLILNQRIRLTIAANAKNEAGVTFGMPIEYAYNVSPSLRITSHIPGFNETEISPQTDAFYVSFNLPVVDLSLSESNFPTAFRVEPGISGEGKWISSSTYAFFPERGLVGGSNYTLVMNRQLKSLYGTILEVDQSMEWSFLTSGPEVLSVFPDNTEQIPLDQEFVITFNQPMQSESVAVNFRMRDIAGNPLSGRFVWNNEFSEMKFIPEKLLDRGRVYILEILPGSQMKGGGELTERISVSYSTVQILSILSTNPANGQPIDLINNNDRIIINFSTSIDPTILLDDFIKVYPSVENLAINRENDGRNLSINASFETGISYQVLISREIRDRWSGQLSEDYLLNFVVSPTRPEIIINHLYDGHTLIIQPDEFAVDIEVINLPTVQTKIYNLDFPKYIEMIQNPNQEMIGNLISDFRQPITTLSNKKVSETLLLNLNEEGLMPGIYAVELSANQMETKRFFILVNHDFIISKLSENQLFVWLTKISSVQSVSGQQITIKNDQSEVIFEDETNEQGVLIWDSFYVSDQTSSIWIEVDDSDNQQYSLMNTAWTDHSLPETFGLNYQPKQEKFKIFWSLDKTVYNVRENLSGFGSIQMNEFGDIHPPDFQEFNLSLIDFYDQNEVRYSFPVQLSPMGVFIFNEELPSQLENGPYYLAFDGLDVDKKLIQIQNKPLSQEFSLIIDVPKSQYFFDSEIVAKINLDYIYGDFGKNIAFNWRILAKELEQTDLYSRFSTNNLSNMNPVDEYILLDEGFDVLDDLGNYDLSYQFSKTENILKNKDVPYQIIVEVNVGSENEFIAFASKQVVLYPDRINMIIDVEPFYEATDSIEVGFSMLDWQSFPIGAVNFDLRFQKLIKTNTETLQNSEWVNLFQESLRSDGQGKSETTVIPNGPGIYKIHVENETFSESKILFFAGQGLTQFPLDEHGHLPLAVNKEQYYPGDTIQLFIPNPFPEPSLALVTVEQNDVSFYDLVQMNSGQKLIDLNLDLSEANEYFVSVVLISTISRQIVQGYTDIKTIQDSDDLIVSTKIYEEDPTTMEISVRDNQGNPVRSELIIQAIQKDQILSAEDFIVLTQSFWDSNKIGVSTAGVVQNGIFSRGALEKQSIPNDMIWPLQKNDQISWQTIKTTDLNGNYILDLNTQYSDPVNEKISIFAIDDKVHFGYKTVNIPLTKTVETTVFAPKEVFEGDIFELKVISNNLMDFPQSIEARMDLFGLSSDSTPVVNLILPTNGERSFFWKINATAAGSHDLKLRIKNPAEEIYEYNFSITVFETPKLQKVVKVGKLVKRNSLDEQFIVQQLDENFGHKLNLGLLPSLSGIIKPSITSLTISPEFENEEAALVLLSYSQAIQLENNITGLGSSDQVVNTEQIRQLINHIIKNQNIDGGWGLNPEQRNSEMQATLISTWALWNVQENGFNIPENVLEEAVRYILDGLVSFDSLSETVDYDLLAWQYYILTLLQVENIDPLVLFPNIESFSYAGKAMVSMGINEVWPVDQRSRQILDDLVNELTVVNEVVLWKNNLSTLRLFASEIQTSAIVVYAIANQNPADDTLIRVVDSIFVNQKDMWMWHNTHETSMAILAISSYISGRGSIISNYSANAELNGTEIVSIHPPYDLFTNSVQANIGVYPLLLTGENELSVKRGEGEGNLYYYIDLKMDDPEYGRKRPISKVSVNRFIINENEVQACNLVDLCTLSEFPQYKKNEPIDVLLQFTVFEKINHLVINEKVPNGFKIINPPYLLENQVLKKYDPLILQSESAFNIHIKQENILSYYAESIPSGTYYLRYTLLPEFAGSYYWPVVDVFSLADHTVSASTKAMTIEINP